MPGLVSSIFLVATKRIVETSPAMMKG